MCPHTHFMAVKILCDYIVVPPPIHTHTHGGGAEYVHKFLIRYVLLFRTTGNKFSDQSAAFLVISKHL